MGKKVGLRFHWSKKSYCLSERGVFEKEKERALRGKKEGEILTCFSVSPAI